MNWHVIYTKSRFEKSVSERLKQVGFGVYCPVLKIKKRWSDRWKWVEEPLFRSYCFVKVDVQNREKVLSIPGVVRYIFHCGKPAVIREKELGVLKDWLANYKHDTLAASVYNIDDKLRLRSGALVNKEGAVMEARGNFAILYLNDLGLRVKVDLRKNLVEKV